MNAHVKANHTDTATPLQPSFGEVYETLSDWFDIRVAEMSGFDYIFAPMEICDEITDFVTLQNFLGNIQALLRSDPERTVLIGFEKNESGDLEMDRYDIDWSESLIIDCSRSKLNGTAQFEFVEMLLEHSVNLIDDVE
ncbi:hypothetical protein [Teredinibacter haidensis]|uniref:hypothetical protein n=1 Tax=Teredinibacter haidensis TaxID=2731755 RepID=UPI000948A246|nr:hypothetical protein [Teredinibacter haidensis]